MSALLPVVAVSALLEDGDGLQLEELCDVVEEGEEDYEDEVGQTLALAHLHNTALLERSYLKGIQNGPSAKYNYSLFYIYR